MKKENSRNKKYNWEYHKKLNKKYESYLIQNKDKNNLRLKGNYHYENKPLNYYLYKKEFEPINNSNLTPLPQSKYLNNRTKDTNEDDYKKFSNIQKSVVEMRRIEYTVKLNKKKKKEESEEEEDNISHFVSVRKKESARSLRNLGDYSPLKSEKSKKLNRKEIIQYILKNLDKLEEGDIPKEVKNYLLIFMPALNKIQRNYKSHFKNLKYIIKIQVNFRAHFYSKLFKEYLIRKEKTIQFIYIIQKVLFLNLYHLKVNPNPKFSSNKCFFSKKTYSFDELNKIIFLQKEIKIHLSNKNLKRIYGKKKCIYIKPFTIKPINKIKLIQHNTILFLERLKRRHITPQSQIFFKKKTFTKKIVLIQRFAKTIHHDVIHPLITKDTYCQNNIFVKINRKYAIKKTKYIDTNIKPFNPKDLNIRIINKDSKITKLHKYLSKIIFLQRNIRIYLTRDDYDIYDYPKCEEYITKESYILPNKKHIVLLQKQIKYFLYRQKAKEKTIKKKVILPLKCTKTIRTNTEKIFRRLSKLRIMYDKNMILFIVKTIEVIRKNVGKIVLDSIVKETKRYKIFSVKGGKFKNAFAKSFLIKRAVLKVIEPEYKIVPVKKKDAGNKKSRKGLNENQNIKEEKKEEIKEEDIENKKEINEKENNLEKVNGSNHSKNKEKEEKKIEKKEEKKEDKNEDKNEKKNEEKNKEEKGEKNEEGKKEGNDDLKEIEKKNNNENKEENKSDDKINKENKEKEKIEDIKENVNNNENEYKEEGKESRNEKVDNKIIEDNKESEVSEEKENKHIIEAIEEKKNEESEYNKESEYNRNNKESEYNRNNEESEYIKDDEEVTTNKYNKESKNGNNEFKSSENNNSEEEEEK